MDFRSKIKDLFKTEFRYCFEPDLQGDYPKVNEEELHDFVLIFTGLVAELRKEAFMVGYEVAAKDYASPKTEEELGAFAAEMVINPERAFLEWDKR